MQRIVSTIKACFSHVQTLCGYGCRNVRCDVFYYVRNDRRVAEPYTQYQQFVYDPADDLGNVAYRISDNESNVRQQENELAIAIISVAVGIFSWFGIREQINVGDKQFAKGMIPHHAAAILMSEKAHLTDPELIELQKNILKTQAQEIELMKRNLKSLKMVSSGLIAETISKN
jgi:hypothetical protein